MDLRDHLSEHFTLGEMVASDVAHRHPKVRRKQENPPDDIVFSLNRLTALVLQPVRDHFRFPITVSSGYRCGDLNRLVRGAKDSQHIMGQAADIKLAPGFGSDYGSAVVRENALRELSHADAHPNFLLFVYICANLETLCVDQVIHEKGSKGRPAWVHVSSGPRQRRNILAVGGWTRGRYRNLTLDSALSLGSEDTNDGSI